MGLFDLIVLYPKLLITLPVLGEREQKEGLNMIYHLFRIDEQTRDMKFCSLRRKRKPIQNVKNEKNISIAVHVI